MCRSIKKLRYPDRAPTDQELEEAALQFIRKISGYRVPAERNRRAFEKAVKRVLKVSREMFEELGAVASGG